MAWRGALLLLVCLAVGAGAAPADFPFDCCRDGSADDKFFNAPKNIINLDACKKYCESKQYGGPVFYGGSWACAPTRGYSCKKVAKSFCMTSLGNLNRYFRFYALSFFKTVRVDSTITSSGTDSSATDTNTNDRVVRRRNLLGGSVTDIRKESGLTQADLSSTNEGVTRTTNLLSETRNFGGGRSTILDKDLTIDVGRTGRVNLTRTTGIVRTEIGGITRTNVVVDTATDGSQVVSGPDGSQSAVSRLVNGSETTSGVDNNKRTSVQNTNVTSVSVRDDAKLNPNRLIGDRPEGIRIGDLSTDVDTKLISARGETVDVGSGIRDIRRRSEERRVQLDTNRGGAGLRSETIGIVGSTVQKFVTDGSAVTETDGISVSKDGIGSIEQVTNNTKGTQGNTTSTVDVEDKVSTIDKNTECDNCASTGTETTRSKDIKDTVVTAQSDFKDKTMSTSTTSGGKKIDLIGSTLSAQNGTVQDTQTQSTKVSDRAGKVEKDCDYKAGGCRAVTQSSGSSTVVSRNSTKVKRDVDFKKDSVSVVTYG